MNNMIAGVGGVCLSGAAVIGMIDPSSVDGWLRSGAFGVGIALLSWQLIRAYKRQDELQRQATEALQKCATCPLARAANERFINEDQGHEHGTSGD